MVAAGLAMVRCGRKTRNKSPNLRNQLSPWRNSAKLHVRTTKRSSDGPTSSATERGRNASTKRRRLAPKEFKGGFNAETPTSTDRLEFDEPRRQACARAAMSAMDASGEDACKVRRPSKSPGGHIRHQPNRATWKGRERLRSGRRRSPAPRPALLELRRQSDGARAVPELINTKPAGESSLMMEAAREEEEEEELQLVGACGASPSPAPEPGGPSSSLPRPHTTRRSLSPHPSCFYLRPISSPPFYPVSTSGLRSFEGHSRSRSPGIRLVVLERVLISRERVPAPRVYRASDSGAKWPFRSNSVVTGWGWGKDGGSGRGRYREKEMDEGSERWF